MLRLLLFGCFPPITLCFFAVLEAGYALRSFIKIPSPNISCARLHVLPVELVHFARLISWTAFWGFLTSNSDDWVDLLCQVSTKFFPKSRKCWSEANACHI